MLYAFANGFVTGKGLTKNPIKQKTTQVCLRDFVVFCCYIIPWAKIRHCSGLSHERLCCELRRRCRHRLFWILRGFCMRRPLSVHQYLDRSGIGVRLLRDRLFLFFPRFFYLL